MSTHVNARWAGGSAVIIDGTLLQPGDEYPVPEGEARESGNWIHPDDDEKPAKRKRGADTAEEEG